MLCIYRRKHFNFFCAYSLSLSFSRKAPPQKKKTETLKFCFLLFEQHARETKELCGARKKEKRERTHTREREKETRSLSFSSNRASRFFLSFFIVVVIVGKERFVCCVLKIRVLLLFPAKTKKRLLTEILYIYVLLRETEEEEEEEDKDRRADIKEKER